MPKAQLDGVLHAVASTTNPLITNLEFVFTDFLPNKNKQGVSSAEIDNLVRTGVDMPVKADFRHGKLGDHTFSIPVGHVTAMEPRTDQVIGRAILYKDEFPDLTAHLEKASASDKGVHFSWELYHGNSTIDDAGITWLQDCVVAGVTIVANPAYAGRTPLLAMASEDKLDELERQVAELQEQLSRNGSIDSMDPIEELKQQVVALTTRIDTLTTPPTEEVVSPDVAALTSELDELRAFKKGVETQQARAAILTTRRDALKDVLAGDEFDKKSDFIADLSDEQFKTFTESLTTIAQKNKQSAGFRGNNSFVPDPISGSDVGNSTSISELAKAFRGAK